MRRKIYDKLLQWKQGNGKSALLIKGARRVGKSYIVEEFAKNEYKSYIGNYVNDDRINEIVMGSLIFKSLKNTPFKE